MFRLTSTVLGRSMCSSCSCCECLECFPTRESFSSWRRVNWNKRKHVTQWRFRTNHTSQTSIKIKSTQISPLSVPLPCCLLKFSEITNKQESPPVWKRKSCTARAECSAWYPPPPPLELDGVLICETHISMCRTYHGYHGLQCADWTLILFT